MIKMIFFSCEKATKTRPKETSKQLHEFSRIGLRKVCCKKKTQIKKSLNLWQKNISIHLIRENSWNSWQKNRHRLKIILII